MLSLLFENDFVLAKMLPICTVVNNAAMTVAIANADVLWLFAIILTVWFSSPQISSSSSISGMLHNNC
jgi:hypothetical protein